MPTNAGSNSPSLPSPETAGTALVIVDHGSRLPEANRVVEAVAAEIAGRGEYLAVEPAHMELAEPGIAAAFARCAAAGARRVIVIPYFLAPGGHAREDIPRLAGEAASAHPGVEWAVAEPLGLDARIMDIVVDRAREAERAGIPRRGEGESAK